MQKPERTRWLDTHPHLRPEEDLVQKAAEYYQQADEGKRTWMRVKPWSLNPFEYFFHTYMGFLHLVRAAKLKPFSRVLDAGSGTGWTSEVLARLGHQVVAVEPCAEAVEIGKERSFAYNHSANNGLPLDLSFHTGDLFSYEADEQSFDAAFFYDCLHHMDDEEELFAKLKAWIKPGGVLAISEGVPPEPGTQNEKDALSEMAEFGVLENTFYPEYLDYLLLRYGFPDFRRLAPITAELSEGEIRANQHRDFLLALKDTNFIIAKRMNIEGDTTLVSEGLDARLTLISRQVMETETVFNVEMTNTGKEHWIPGGKGDTGEINLGIFLSEDGENWHERGPRMALPDWLHPGQSTTLNVTLPTVELEGQKGIRFELVCELRFWGHQRQAPPLEKTF